MGILELWVLRTVLTPLSTGFVEVLVHRDDIIFRNF